MKRHNDYIIRSIVEYSIAITIVGEMSDSSSKILLCMLLLQVTSLSNIYECSCGYPPVMGRVSASSYQVLPCLLSSTTSLGLDLIGSVYQFDVPRAYRPAVRGHATYSTRVSNKLLCAHGSEFSCMPAGFQNTRKRSKDTLLFQHQLAVISCPLAASGGSICPWMYIIITRAMQHCGYGYTRLHHTMVRRYI